MGPLLPSAGRFAIGLIIIFLLCYWSHPTHAAITWSGNVTPDDPSTWTSTTTARIANTADGTMDITDGSDVVSQSASIGLEAGSSGIVNVDGVNSTWDNFGGFAVGNQGQGDENKHHLEAQIIFCFSHNIFDIDLSGAPVIWAANAHFRAGPCLGFVMRTNHFFPLEKMGRFVFKTGLERTARRAWSRNVHQKRCKLAQYIKTMSANLRLATEFV